MTTCAKDNGERTISTAEFAEQAGVSITTICKWYHKNRVHPVNAYRERAWRWSVTAVESFLNQRQG